MHNQPRNQQGICRRPQTLRFPCPGDEQQEQRDHVDHHAEVEGLGLVEQELLIGLALGIGAHGENDLLQLYRCLVECIGIARGVGGSNGSKEFQRGMNLALRIVLESGCHGLPSIHVCFRQDAEIGKLVHLLETRIGIGIFRTLDLRSQTLRILGLKGVLQLMVEIDPLEEIEDRVLGSRPLALFQVHGSLGLLLDLVQVRSQRIEAEVAVRGLLNTHGSQEFRIVDDEDGLGICAGGTEQDIQHPLVRTNGAAINVDALLAADHEQGGARDGIQRFHAPALEDRQLREPSRIETAHVSRGQKGQQHRDQCDEARSPGEELAHVHAVLPRFKERPRVNPKWIMRPSVMRVQEM